MTTRILLVDDEPLYLKSLARSLADTYEVDTCSSGTDLLKRILEKDINYDVILLDYSLRDYTADSLIPRLVEEKLPTKIILVSGQAKLNEVIRCVNLGAYDFVEKPVNIENLFIKIENAVAMLRIEGERLEFRAGMLDKYPLIGSSPEMLKMKERIAKYASLDTTILINGESGSGKEVVAHHLHYMSGRANGPLQVINCAAINKELSASLLFGHVKGSFTGAIEDQKGHVALANKGTLFLDEIGDMPMDVQSQLLRFMETGEYHRVGDTALQNTDARIVAATHRDLEERVEANEFRQDLYYRLNVAIVSVPPLRDHLDDIPDLVNHFTRQLAMTGKCGIRDFTDDALRCLQSMEWKGNVRELKNFVERVSILTEEEKVDEKDVLGIARNGNRSAADFTTTADGPIEDILQETEKNIIIKRLQKYHGSIPETAESLGLHRSNLYRKIAKYDIDVSEIAS